MKSKREFRNKKKHYRNSKKKVYYGGTRPTTEEDARRARTKYITQAHTLLSAINEAIGLRSEDRNQAYVNLRDFLAGLESDSFYTQQDAIHADTGEVKNVLDMDMQQATWRPSTHRVGDTSLLFRLLNIYIHDEDIPIVNKIIDILGDKGANMFIQSAVGKNILDKEIERKRTSFFDTLLKKRILKIC